MGLDVGDVLGPVHPMSILAEQEIEESIEIEWMVVVDDDIIVVESSFSDGSYYLLNPMKKGQVGSIERLNSPVQISYCWLQILALLNLQVV